MCHLCNTNPVYEFTNKRKLCSACFIRYFQKKTFYTIRKFKMIKNGDVIYIGKNKGFRDIVLKNILKLFEEKSNITITNSKNNPNKIAVSLTLDSESEKIIDILINKNAEELNSLSPIENKKISIIKPLYLFLDKEVLLYAKLKGLKFKQEKKKFSKIQNLLNDTENKHPEVKRAVVNSFLKIYNQ